MKNNLLSKILIVPNVISSDGVNFIINHAKKQDTLTDLSVFDPSKSNATKSTKFTVDKKVRDTQIIELETISDEIVDLYRNIVSNVINPFYEVEIKDSEIPQLLHYGIGGHYKPHCDGESLWKPPGNHPIIWRKSTDRDLSTVLFLNNDFEGGEFAFFDREFKYKLEKGDALLFPSNFMYPHEVMPVTKGTRYSIVTWFI